MTLQELREGLTNLKWMGCGSCNINICDSDEHLFCSGEIDIVLRFLADKGACFLDDAQTLPAIPDFGYDKEEYRPYLKRGAINYTKMLNDFKRVVSLKSMIENE